MEKQEVGILIAFILGVFVIGFYGKLTGNVVNNTGVECNIADFNADGIVNYVDKEDFGEAYSLSPINKKACNLLDFNSDGAISILDANAYNKLYDKNYGAHTGECIQRTLACEESELNLEPEPDLIAEKPLKLAEEKPNLFNWIKNVFRNLF